MNKAYLISKSGGVFDNDYTEVGIFLDKQQAEEYVKEKNILYREQYKIYEQCEECYDDIVKFKLKDSCNRACIKEDRYGEYCKNKMEYYDIEHDYYTITEIDILDKESK